MIDVSFEIDHAKLQSIFKQYKIRTKWVGIQNTAGANPDAVEISPENTSLAKYLIGAVFQANEAMKEDVIANASNCMFSLVEDWSPNSQKGKSIIPDRQEVLAQFTNVFPYDLPITTLAEQQILTDALGANHYIFDSKLKCNLDYLMQGGHHLWFLSLANFNTVDSVCIVMYAEGELR